MAVQIFNDISGLIKALVIHLAGHRSFILTDETVSEHWLHHILPALEGTEVIEIEPGENSKSLEICSQIWTHLLEDAAGKDVVLINVGGGVVTDLGGFVASAYKRGIPFVNIPTTLLGMVDAAIGGKTGINHSGIKNAIGSVAEPMATLICTTFLETLPERELKSGFAEMLKHALIHDAIHWKELTAISSISVNSIANFIKLSATIKEKIACSDPLETGERRLLNLGHTIGHAIEAAAMETNRPFTHGEAIALGMIAETKISESLNMINRTDAQEIISAIEKFFPLFEFHVPAFNNIKKFLLNDKKNLADEMRMTLPEKPGKATYNVKVGMDHAQKVYSEIFLNE